MDLVCVYNCNEPAEISVMYSKVRAAGLSPYMQNYHQIYNDYFQGLALGGFNILVPEIEYDHALTICKERFPLLDFDPIKPSRFPQLFPTVLAACIFWLFAIFIEVFLQGISRNHHFMISVVSMPLVIIYLHAKFVARSRLGLTANHNRH